MIGSAQRSVDSAMRGGFWHLAPVDRISASLTRCHGYIVSSSKLQEISDISIQSSSGRGVYKAPAVMDSMLMKNEHSHCMLLLTLHARTQHFGLQSLRPIIFAMKVMRLVYLSVCKIINDCEGIWVKISLRRSLDLGVSKTT